MNDETGSPKKTESGKKTELPRELESSLEQHMVKVGRHIREKAVQLAKEEADGPRVAEVSILHLATAIRSIAPGIEIEMNVGAEKPVGFFRRLPPVTTISAVLTVVFGVIGVLAIRYGGNNIEGRGFVDIAKIFAGAIVGSATAAAAMKPGR